MPQRGAKHAFLELVEKNARHSFEQRFRVLKPSSKAIVEALEQALSLPEPPRRIESFDISHLQGTDTVASMVVWEDGRMKKSDYRKFIIRGEWGNDDFASMKETVERRYKRLQDEKKPFPGLILIDGGIGQLHAAGAALEKLEVINQPVASIAKQEEIIYVLGQEDQPIRLEHHSPILHLIQQIRDETHRFAVGFHRQRRSKRTIQTGLENIPGVGPRIAQKLLRNFGSVEQLRSASVEQIAKVVPRGLAERVSAHLAGIQGAAAPKQ
jgi:excinuclease ABC subunit C